MTRTAPFLLLVVVACSASPPHGSSTGTSTGATGATTSGSTAGSTGSSSGSTTGSGSLPVGDCDDGGWCWMNPLPQGNDLLALAGTSEDDVWAAGDVGTVRHWDGQRWTSIPGPSRDPVVALTACAPHDVWGVLASAPAAQLAHYDGAAWSRLDAGTLQLDPITHALFDRYLACDGGPQQRFRLENGGASFYGFPSGELFRADDTVEELFRDGGVLTIAPRAASGAPFGSIAGRTPSDIDVVNASGSASAPLLHWDGRALSAFGDAGSFWDGAYTLGATATDVAMLAPTVNGIGHLLPDGGIQTAPLSTAFNAIHRVLWGPAGGAVDWAAGGLGAIQRSDGAAQTFGATGPVTEQSLQQAAWVPRRDLAVIPFGANALRFDGRTWALDPTLFAEVVAGSSDHEALCVGRHGTLVASHWDGSRWTAVAAPSAGSAQLLALAATGGGAYVLATSQGLFHFDGTHWTASPGAPFGATCLAASSGSDIWACGSSTAGSNLSHFDGTSWTASNLPSPQNGSPTIISMTDVGGEVWAAAPGLLARFDGHTWRTFTTADLPRTAWATTLEFVSAVRARGPGDVWVGLAAPSALHWNGTVLEQIDLPADFRAMDFGLPPTGETFVIGSHGQVLVHP